MEGQQLIAQLLGASRCAHGGCASFGGGLRHMPVDLSGNRGGAQARHYWVQVCGTSGKPSTAREHA